MPADDPSLSPAGPDLAHPKDTSGEPDPAEQVFDSQGRAIVDYEPSAIDQLEQAAAAAGGELVVEETDVVQHPDAAARKAVHDEIATTPPNEVEKQEEAAAGPGTKTLFDASDYEREDLAVPKIDGNAIDRLALAFSGGIMLDRSEPKDVALYNRVHGQKTIELWVEAKWGGTLASPNTNRDGDLDVIVGRKTLKVESIRIIDADALGAVEGLEMIRAAVRRAARAGVPADQIEAATIHTLAETD